MEGSRVEHKLEVGREAAVASGAKASLPSEAEPLLASFVCLHFALSFLDFRWQFSQPAAALEVDLGASFLTREVDLLGSFLSSRG